MLRDADISLIRNSKTKILNDNNNIRHNKGKFDRFHLQYSYLIWFLSYPNMPYQRLKIGSFATLPFKTKQCVLHDRYGFYW